MPSEKRQFGDIGEDLCVKHLVKHGYRILDKNYLKKWGEIDVIAKKNGIIHFVEVKSKDLKSFMWNNLDLYSPEENVHPWKLKRLSRAIQTYLMEKNIDDEIEWQIDIAAVFIDFDSKKATIKIIEDIGF